MSALSAVKAFIPPVIVGLYQRRLASRPVPTWRDAIAKSGNDYAMESLNAFRVERAILNRQNRGAPPDNFLTLVALLADRDQLSICDFGGATGELGEAILSRLPDVKYTVVENARLALLAKKKLSTAVQFATTIPATCNIFFSSGTLQYIERPLEIWREALASAQFACILTRNSFSEQPIIRVQRSNLFDNGYGAIPAGYRNRKIFYPHQTISEQALTEVAKTYGFSLALRLAQNDGVLPYRNKVYGAQLVFIKKSTAINLTTPISNEA